MNENVDDLEKAIKVIATIPEKGDQPEEPTVEQDAKEEADSGLAAAKSPLPAVLGEASDKLSQMLKNVLQAKVTRHLLLIMCARVNTLSVSRYRTTLTSSKAMERLRKDLYFYSKHECL